MTATCASPGRSHTWASLDKSVVVITQNVPLGLGPFTRAVPVTTVAGVCFRYDRPGPERHLGQVTTYVMLARVYFPLDP